MTVCKRILKILVLCEFSIDSMKEKILIYFTFFLFISNQILLKNLCRFAKYSHCLIENPQKYIFSLFIFYLFLSYIVTHNFSIILKIIFFFLLSAYIFQYVGWFLFMFFFINHLKGFLFQKFLIKKMSEDYNLSVNIFASNFSVLISLIFIIFVYSENQIVRFYYKIYHKIFYLKLLFDIELIFKFIMEIYSQNKEDYLNIFQSSYRIFLLSFAIQYLLIFLSVNLKLNFKLDESTFVSLFGENKKILVEYNRSTPYFEIKLNKVRYF